MEKISSEIGDLLIRNNAFNSILFLIEFFDLNLRKHAITICLKLSKNIKNSVIYRQFILPSIPNLINLLRYSGNTEIEKFILDSAINCFYYILKSIKSFKLDFINKDIYKEIYDFGLVHNLFEIILNIINLMKSTKEEEKNKDYSIKTQNNKMNLNYCETLKKIFIIFEFLNLKSDEIANKFLDIEQNYTNINFNISIFEIINIIIDCEINNNNFDIIKNKNNEENIFLPRNKNLSNEIIKNNIFYECKSFHQIFNHLFSFLTSLYPQEILYERRYDKNQKDENLVVDTHTKRVIHSLCNSNFQNFIYNFDKTGIKEEIQYFPKIGILNNLHIVNKEIKIKNLQILVNEIIPKLLENYVNFSSSNSSFKLLKFIKVFIKNSNKELIQRTINPSLISNMFSSNILINN